MPGAYRCLKEGGIIRLQVVFFELVTAFTVEFPGSPQGAEAVLVLGDHLGYPVKATEKGGNLQLQIDQEVVVALRVLPPADRDLLAELAAE